MTPVLVEVGPHTVHGPQSAPAGWASAAIEFLDDPFALVEDRCVATGDLWCDVLRAVAPVDEGDAIVVVLPTWWSRRRTEVVAAAASATFAESTVRHRSTLLTGAGTTVLELSADYAVVTHPDCESIVLAREDCDLATRLQRSGTVLVDTPRGVPPLSDDLADRLGGAGVTLLRNTSERLHRAVAGIPAKRARPRPRMPGRHAVAVMAGVAVTVAAAAGGWVAQNSTAVPRPPTPYRILIEGRVALRVPADWTVDRVTNDSGSARVRVAAPGGLPALHVTQSVGATAAPLHEVGESLRRAIDFEADGTFFEFDAEGSSAGRPAVTYLERRAATQTRWTVIVDGALRIAVGCQHAPDRGHTVESVCAEAVRSAHAVA